MNAGLVWQATLFVAFVTWVTLEGGSRGFGWQVLLFASFVFVLTLSAGARLIPLMNRLAIRQQVYEDAPTTHAVKSGTPTAGGLLFALALVATLALALFSSRWLLPVSDKRLVIALVVLGLGCALVGFVDDYLAIRRGRNRGLRARAKLAAVAAVGALFLVLVLWQGRTYPYAYAPVFPLSAELSTGVWFALGLLTIVAATQAVNLTDGLDGLAAGSVLPPFVVLILISLPAGWDIAAHSLRFVFAEARATFWIDIAVAAAVLGFLYYNRYPARLIMGDTGSLALGGILAGSAILLGMQLLLIVIGGVFVAETLSVILQVASFKLMGKRIFRMSPLHHHFELLGWPETKVTHQFWAASALGSLVGALLVLWPSWLAR